MLIVAGACSRTSILCIPAEIGPGEPTKLLQIPRTDPGHRISKLPGPFRRTMVIPSLPGLSHGSLSIYILHSQATLTPLHLKLSFHRIRSPLLALRFVKVSSRVAKPFFVVSRTVDCTNATSPDVLPDTFKLIVFDDPVAKEYIRLSRRRSEYTDTTAQAVTRFSYINAACFAVKPDEKYFKLASFPQDDPLD